MTNPDPTPPADDIVARLEDIAQHNWRMRAHTADTAREAVAMIRALRAELTMRPRSYLQTLESLPPAFDRRAHLQADAEARQRRENIDGSPRREAMPASPDDDIGARLATATPDHGDAYLAELCAEAAEALRQRDATIAELWRERGEQCEWCGAKVSSYPMEGCPGCGAPQCCQPCCDKATAEARVKALEAERDVLRAGLDAPPWDRAVAAEARATDLRRRLDEALEVLNTAASDLLVLGAGVHRSKWNYEETPAPEGSPRPFDYLHSVGERAKAAETRAQDFIRRASKEGE